MRKRIIAGFVAAVVLAASDVRAQTPLGSEFTYSGELRDASVPVTTAVDLRFRLWDALTGGSTVGPTLLASGVTPAEGRFTVALDFGAAPFSGEARWIEIEVAAAGSGSYTTLTPRQPVSPSPYSVYSSRAGIAEDAQKLAGNPVNSFRDASNLTSGLLASDRLSGSYLEPLVFGNSSNILFGNGAGLTGLSASNVTNGILDPANGGTGSNTSGAAAGQVLKWNGAAWAPAADNNTTYTAGIGLSLSGSTFSLDVPFADTRFLNSNESLAGDVTGPPGSTVVAQLRGNPLSTTAPLSGQVLGWNGTEWAPRSSQTYAAGTGLALVGGDTFVIPPSAIDSAMIAGGAVGASDLGSSEGSFFKVTGGAGWLSAGSFGLGTTSPDATKRLHVSGDMRVDGAITIPSTLRSYSISFAALLPAESVVTYGAVDDDTIGGFLASSSGWPVFYAPVSLPDGAEITQFSISYIDADPDASDNIQAHLYREAHATLTRDLLGSVITSGSSTSLRISLENTITNGTVNNSSYAYYFRFWIPSADTKFRTARILYTVNSPLP